MKYLVIVCCFVSLCTQAQRTFTYLLLPVGSDPWVIYQDGYYYYTNSTGNSPKILPVTL